MKTKFITSIMAALALVASLAFTITPARAAAPDQYGFDAVAITNGSALGFTGGTNHIPASSTNTFNSVITLTKHADFTLQITYKLNAAGTTANVFKFDHSPDGTNWTANALNASVTPAGTSTVHLGTNMTVNGTGYWRLGTVENANSAALTNLQILVWKKPMRYGGQGNR